MQRVSQSVSRSGWIQENYLEQIYAYHATVVFNFFGKGGGVGGGNGKQYRQTENHFHPDNGNNE